MREEPAEDSNWVAVADSAAACSITPLRVIAASSIGAAASVRRKQSIARRTLDVCAAALLLILLAPMLVLTGFAIRLDSRGPALFRQWRRGLNSETFQILKLRTLTVEEDGAMVTQVARNDPRVTRIGRLLRKFSFDELPQLINVLRGEMSLVGPRPHAIAHDRYFTARIENYALRHSVKPGLTGWAQIHGLRGETATLDEMRRRVAFDLWYVRRARLLLDLRILLATPHAVLFARNAW